MRQVLQHMRTGTLELAEVPEPALRPGGILVANICSLISAGTEKMIIDFAGKSLLGKAQDRPDLVRQTFDKIRKDGLAPTVQTVFSRLDQPVALGYSCAGIVEEVGADAGEFTRGQRVACAGMGYASHADVVFVPKNLAVPIPQAVSFEDASYVTLGAIALQGVRVADLRLGETVAVIGLGLLGQLSVQILKANGCLVIGIDLDPHKVSLAIELGADAAVSRTDNVRTAVDRLTGGVGVDAVVITAATDSNDPIELAGEISRDRARVSVVGAVKMDIPRKVYYEKELELRLSRSYGPGRYDPLYEEKGRDYPIAYVRWTERRNMSEFLRLVSSGAVSPARLTTHRFPIRSAQDAYGVVTGKAAQPFSGVVLEYEQERNRVQRVEFSRPKPFVASTVGIGFIGAGNFARAVLLPAFKRRKNAALVGLATENGATAHSAGRAFGFSYATTDVEQLLADDLVHAVVIATRHGSHARLVADALGAGKAVLVEKPLALDEVGLASILAVGHDSRPLLAVGFNRRFSRLSMALKSAMGPSDVLAINYRVNAGPVSADSWLHDPDEGGGRIIGEVCHFIDLLQFLTDDIPVAVHAVSAGGPTARLHDTVGITLKFARGSVATVSYYAIGDKSFSKERIEASAGGTIGVLEDFRELVISKGGRQKRTRLYAQDKGYEGEIDAFLRAVTEGGPAPIPLESLVATTRATFAIEESLRTGQPVAL